MRCLRAVQAHSAGLFIFAPAPVRVLSCLPTDYGFMLRRQGGSIPLTDRYQPRTLPGNLTPNRPTPGFMSSGHRLGLVPVGDKWIELPRRSRSASPAHGSRLFGHAVVAWSRCLYLSKNSSCNSSNAGGAFRAIWSGVQCSAAPNATWNRTMLDSWRGVARPILNPASIHNRHWRGKTG